MKKRTRLMLLMSALLLCGAASAWFVVRSTRRALHYLQALAICRAHRRSK